MTWFRKLSSENHLIPSLHRGPLEIVSQMHGAESGPITTLKHEREQCVLMKLDVSFVVA